MLDGLRGIAALWVFATHATYVGLLPTLLNFRGAGRAGVILFFFLSAFLLSGPFLRRPGKALSWREWAAYSAKRVCRIVPLYFGVVLFLFLLRLFPFDDGAGPAVLFRHLVFREGRGVFWTIPVEMRFYLVLPILLTGMAFTVSRLRMGRLLVLVAGAAWIVGAALGLWPRVLLRLGMGAYAPIFVTGVFAALVAHELSRRGPGRGAAIAFEGLAWLSAIAFVCLSVPAVYHAIGEGASIAAYSASRPVYERFWDARLPWIGLILGCLFVSLSAGVGTMRRVLSWRPLVYVGRISFGLYLVHLDVLYGVAKTGLPPSARLLLAVLTTVAVADLLYRLVEAPAIAGGRRIASSLGA